MKIKTTKELVVARNRSEEIEKKSSQIKISTEAQSQEAVKLLKKIADTEKIVKEQKDKIAKPLLESLRNIREFFSPVEKRLLTARVLLKGKLLTYETELEKKVEQKKKEIVKKVDNGDISFQSGGKRIERYENKKKLISTRTMRDIEITDKSKIPSKYYKLDMVLVRREALSGINIPGVKVVERKIIVAK